MPTPSFHWQALPPLQLTLLERTINWKRKQRRRYKRKRTASDGRLQQLLFLQDLCVWSLPSSVTYRPGMATSLATQGTTSSSSATVQHEGTSEPVQARQVRLLADLVSNNEDYLRPRRTFNKTEEALPQGQDLVKGDYICRKYRASYSVLMSALLTYRRPWVHVATVAPRETSDVNTQERWKRSRNETSWLCPNSTGMWVYTSGCSCHRLHP